MNHINIGCNGLIINKNQILLGKRKNCYGAGTYGLPGGHLEFGEKIVAALKRELQEECGITVNDVTFSSTIDQAEPDRHYIQVNFVINDFEGEIKTLEPDLCEGWEWFALDQLPVEMFPPHQSIISAYLQHASFTD